MPVGLLNSFCARFLFFFLHLFISVQRVLLMIVCQWRRCICFCTRNGTTPTGTARDGVDLFVNVRSHLDWRNEWQHCHGRLCVCAMRQGTAERVRCIDLYSECKQKERRKFRMENIYECINWRMRCIVLLDSECAEANFSHSHKKKVSNEHQPSSDTRISFDTTPNCFHHFDSIVAQTERSCVWTYPNFVNPHTTSSKTNLTIFFRRASALSLLKAEKLVTPSEH